MLSAVLLTESLIASGQQAPQWVNTDAAYNPLPPAIHVYRTNDSLDGYPFIAYYVSAKLKDRELSFTTSMAKEEPLPPSRYYRQGGLPMVVVNAGFFSAETNQPLSLVMKDGRQTAHNIVSLIGAGADSLLYYYPTRGALGIDAGKNADVAWIFTDSSRRCPYAFEEGPVSAKGPERAPAIYSLKDIEWKWWKVRTAVGGGPVLIHNGRIRITEKEEQIFAGGGTERLARTAMGYTGDGRLIILAVQGGRPGIAEGALLEQEAKIMKALGCYEALNLDGGESSCLLVNGKETIKPSGKEGQKPLPAVFLINWKQ